MPWGPSRHGSSSPRHAVEQLFFLADAEAANEELLGIWKTGQRFSLWKKCGLGTPLSG